MEEEFISINRSKVFGDDFYIEGATNVSKGTCKLPIYYGTDLSSQCRTHEDTSCEREAT